jgi:hypothetical protein
MEYMQQSCRPENHSPTLSQGGQTTSVVQQLCPSGAAVYAYTGSEVHLIV